MKLDPIMTEITARLVPRQGVTADSAAEKAPI
jgi:hypothetical protein